MSGQGSAYFGALNGIVGYTIATTFAARIESASARTTVSRERANERPAGSSTHRPLEQRHHSIEGRRQHVVERAIRRVAGLDRRPRIVHPRIARAAGEVAEQGVRRRGGRLGIHVHVAARLRRFGEEIAIVHARHRRVERLDGRSRCAQVVHRAVPRRDRLGGHLRARDVRLDDAEPHPDERVVAQRGQRGERDLVRRDGTRQRIRRIRARDHGEHLRRVGHACAPASRACRGTATSGSRRCARRARRSASPRRRR